MAAQNHWLNVSYTTANEVNHMHVNVFNLMSKINETRFLIQHELCKCKCGLNENVYNSKQKWNHEGCCCECDCECNKVYKIDEYLEIKKLCVKNVYLIN